MEKLGSYPIIKKWWELTDPCQQPIKTAKEDEWWATMEAVYHLD